MIHINNLLTLENFLELPNLVLKISESEENEYLDLLSVTKCNQYYYSDLKKDLKEYIRKFNDVKYNYGIGEEIWIKSSNFDIKENKITRSNNDKVSSYVNTKIDNELFAVDVYNKIISLAHKLTKYEALYFIEAFFKNSSDEYISEKLKISRNGLQRIRKSCLVKMFLEFKLNL